MGTVETDAASFPGPSQRPEIVVGLLASPGAASELTESLLPEIADRLPEQLPGVRVARRIRLRPAGPAADRLGRGDLGRAADAAGPRLAPGGVRDRLAAADRAAAGDRPCQHHARRRGPVHARAWPGLGAQAHSRHYRPADRAHARRHRAGGGRQAAPHARCRGSPAHA